MPGISTIIKKEISDAVTNRSFLLSFGILVLCMVIAGFAAGNTFNSERFGLSKDRLIILSDIAPIITLLGALVAVALGFNSINKERPEGSLKVMLSYPIYRDQIILGKLFGNLIIMSIATTASTGISLALYLQMTKIVLDSEMLVRYTTLTLLAILLLSGYLGLSISVISIHRRSKDDALNHISLSRHLQLRNTLLNRTDNIRPRIREHTKSLWTRRICPSLPPREGTARFHLQSLPRIRLYIILHKSW